MKVAFVTFPHSGQFNPMSALARRLQTRAAELLEAGLGAELRV
jgi:hypothetical protein